MTERNPNDSESRLLRQIQVAAGVVFLVLIVLQVVLDPIGRLFIDPTFHVNETLFALSLGAFLGILGVTFIKPPWSKP